MSSVWLLLAVVGRVQIDQNEVGDADGQVDEKDEPPMQIIDDQAAGDGLEHRADQAGNGDEAHGADQFGLGERTHQREAADRNHHGATAALQDAADDKQVDVARHAAEDRSEGEEADGGRKHKARAEAVGHPAADWNEHGKAQRVTGQHRFHADRVGLERASCECYAVVKERFDAFLTAALSCGSGRSERTTQDVRSQRHVSGICRDPAFSGPALCREIRLRRGHSAWVDSWSGHRRSLWISAPGPRSARLDNALAIRRKSACKAGL